jgi:hypothetical protein
MKERNELRPDPLNREAYVMLETEQRSVGGSSYVQEAWMKENGRQKGRLPGTVRKELRVAISGNRSPLSLRIAKWVLFLSGARRLYSTRWFRAWVFGLPVAGLATHFLYRHMTHGWTRPWGGWKDVEADRPRSET